MSEPTIHDVLGEHFRPMAGVPGEGRIERLLDVVVAGVIALQRLAPAYRAIVETEPSDERRATARAMAIELGALLQRAYRDAEGLDGLRRSPFDPGVLFLALGQMQATLVVIADPDNERYAVRLGFSPDDAEAMLATDEIQRLVRLQEAGSPSPER